jgi:hypothetical protein
MGRGVLLPGLGGSSVIFAPQRFGDSPLELLALQVLGDQLTIGSDPEWRAGALYRVVEFERFRSAVAEYGLRRGAVAGY